MELYKVTGNVDDGYTMRDGISTMLVVAANERDAKGIFVNHYNDGWGGYAYNVKVEGVSVMKEGIVGFLYPPRKYK